MNQQSFTPDIEQVKKVSRQFQEIFKRIDREILVLDNMIAELDNQILPSPLYKRRKNHD